MKKIYLLLLCVLLNSCSKDYIEQKYGFKIESLNTNLTMLKIGLPLILLGLGLFLLYMNLETKYEDTNNWILKSIINISMLLGGLLLALGCFFLLPIFALIEYIGWYLFALLLIIGALISFFKK